MIKFLNFTKKALFQELHELLTCHMINFYQGTISVPTEQEEMVNLYHMLEPSQLKEGSALISNSPLLREFLNVLHPLQVIRADQLVMFPVNA